jgi:signal transduction histidine kinase
MQKAAKQKGKELALRVRQLEHLAETLAHEMKAPAERMEGLASLVLKKYGSQLDDEARRLLRLIQENGQDLSNRLEIILETARVGSDNERVEPVDPAVVLNEVLKTYTEQLATHRVRVETSLTELLVPCHRAYLRQVFDNLISNAIKYIGDRPDPKIQITGVRQANKVTFSITDNGPGIPARYRERIFEPFMRLNPRSSKGTGLGLTIVKRIVEWHGGRIWIEDGPGCIVKFTLPYLGAVRPSKRNGRLRRTAGPS